MIIWNNDAGLEPEVSGNTTIEYSNVRGGYPGNGNIDLDPLFADPNADLGRVPRDDVVSQGGM